MSRNVSYDFFVFFSVLEELQICFTRMIPKDRRYLWNAKRCLWNFLTSAIIRLLSYLYLFGAFDSVDDLSPERFLVYCDIVYPDVFSNVF